MIATDPNSNTTLNEALAGWKKSVLAELKDVPFEKKLVTRTFEELALQPLYSRADVQTLHELSSLPGQAPFLRGIKRGGSGRAWKVAQDISAPNLQEYNRILLANLQAGQDAIVINPARTALSETAAAPDSDFDSRVELNTVDDFVEALKGVDLNAVEVHLHTGADPRPHAALYLALTENRGLSLLDLKGSITADPLGEALETGQFPHDLGACYEAVATWTRWASEHAPQLQTIQISGNAWGNAGASATQELAFALGGAAEYIKVLLTHGLSLEAVARQLRFQFSIGSQFFSEVAKFRAFRPLFTRLLMAFGAEPRLGAVGTLGATTGRWNKTLIDPHVNLLRTTTEALSAVLGGCDCLCIAPFDEVSGETTELSRRIALNIHTLMAEEFGFAEPADPAGGSWYVERLTDEIARAAWKIFQDIEHRGGFALCLRTGYVQQLVQKVRTAKSIRVASRALSLVGTNLFPPLKSAPLALRSTNRNHAVPSSTAPATSEQSAAPEEEKPDWSYPSAINAARQGASARELIASFGGTPHASTSIAKLDQTRAAEGFEAVRRSMDALTIRLGYQPRVFLAKLGSVKEYKGRADFSSSFFLVGGFAVLPSGSFNDPQAAANAAALSGANISVFCSTDENQRVWAGPFAAELKKICPKMLIVLAGLPTEPAFVASFQTAGFDAFIHARGNAEETLNSFVHQLGSSL